MSLFSTLIHLHSDERRRLEDFHTEIVAHVLSNDSELTVDWLAHLGVTLHGKADSVTIETQKTFNAIEELHDTGSKIDMVIEIRKGARMEIVFVESKIGSMEGDGQLQKYLHHLHAIKGMERRSLVFITRDYEPKEYLSDEYVKFVPTRWSDFYRFMSDRDSNSDTLKDLLQFMKENNMSQNNRFTTIDLLSLTNHSRARSLMESTLGETIANKFENVTRSKWSANDRFRQLKEDSYTMLGNATEDGSVKYKLGYWFPEEQPTDSPDVGLWISVNSSSQEISTISKAMQKFSAASHGKAFVWEHLDRTEWDDEGIWCSKKLEAFFAAENHVAAIVQWFQDLLDDAASFQRENPSLAWITRASEPV